MAKFREVDFENWFCEHPKLPGGSNLLFLSRQQPLLRKIDMLFLDKKDLSLVLIEVKNEKATIRSIGQVLEYLGQYEGLDLEALADEFHTSKNPIRPKISRLLSEGKDLGSQRHIVIAAPDFDYPTLATAALLNERFATAGLKISLLRIKKTRPGFSLRLEEPVKPIPISQLAGKFAVNQRNRLFLVLDIKNSKLLLNVGKIINGKLKRPSQQVSTRRLVTKRKRNVRLVEYQGDHELDVSRQGTWWLHKNGRRRSVILGESKGKKAHVYIAFLDRKEHQGYFSIREKSKFKNTFPTAIDPPQDWKKVVRDNVDSAAEA